MADSDSKFPDVTSEADAASQLILPAEQTDDAEEGSELGDGLYLALADKDEDGADDGLELDDFQSEEIRQIFGTTLPQYLLPVEEMLEQILSGAGDPETVQALLGTLSSIEAAATRMGFDEICQQLGRMNQLIAGLELAAEIPRERREQILGELLDLKDLATQMGGEGAQAPAAAETIYNALKGNKEIGELALRKLSAAGVVTVEQLLMAHPDEVAVVSGLDLALVAKIIQAVAPRAIEEGTAPAPAAKTTPGTPAKETPATGVGETQAALETQATLEAQAALETQATLEAQAALETQTTLEAQAALETQTTLEAQAALEAKLTLQVEAEAALNESKARLLRLRCQIQEKREALDRLKQEAQRQRLQEVTLRSQLAKKLGLVGELREAREGLQRNVQQRDQHLRQAAERLFSLKRKWQELVNQDNQLDVEIESLVERVGGVLRLISDKKLPATNRSRRNN